MVGDKARWRLQEWRGIYLSNGKKLLVAVVEAEDLHIGILQTGGEAEGKY